MADELLLPLRTITDGFCSALAGRGESWQFIMYFQPIQLLIDEHVPAGCYGVFGIRKRGSVQMQFARNAFVLEGKRGTAIGAESPARARG